MGLAAEPYHLFCYLDEQAFRFNERGGKDGASAANKGEQIYGE